MNRNIFQYNSKIGHLFIPNIKSRIGHEGGGYLVKTNNIGFRCNHDFFKEKKAKDIFRILVFGDSYTAGDGVSNKFRYSNLIEQMMLEKEINCEVFNFGLPATGTDQQYLAFKEFAADAEYDLLIISPIAENIRRNMAHARLTRNQEGNLYAKPKPYFKIKKGKLELNNVPVPRSSTKKSKIDKGTRIPGFILKLNKKFPQIGKFIMNLVKFQPYPEYRDGSKGWELMEMILLKWISDAKSPVVLAPIPTYQYIEESASSTDFRRRYKDLINKINKSDVINFQLIDMLPEYYKEPKNIRRTFRFKIDQHPTKEGHKKYAEIILPAVKKQYKRWLKKNK